uniref:Uncharacterized protein n=1 Tax=Arundo donax TaxID=35708 RepID=A0A0A9A0K0_ARUDO
MVIVTCFIYNIFFRLMYCTCKQL